MIINPKIYPASWSMPITRQVYRHIENQVEDDVLAQVWNHVRTGAWNPVTDIKLLTRMQVEDQINTV